VLGAARCRTPDLGQRRRRGHQHIHLLDLAQRYLELGYSSVEFVLRMTREEIGSSLGLKLETVSSD
jgi:CRP/FNR family transcriptional regulator